MKNKILAIALVGSLAAASSALAFDFDPRFYVGGEVNWNSPKYDDVISRQNATDVTVTPKKNKLGGALLAGMKFNENMGVEAGYNFIKKSKTTNSRAGVNSDVSVKLKNFYFDVLGYLPASEEVDFIASIGVGRLKPSVDIANEEIITPSDPNKAKWKLRAGIGAQYKFDDNLAARFMVRYQKGTELIKHNTSAGLGLTWTF